MGLKRCDFGFQTSINNASYGAYFCSQYVEWTHVMLNLFLSGGQYCVEFKLHVPTKKVHDSEYAPNSRVVTWW